MNIFLAVISTGSKAPAALATALSESSPDKAKIQSFIKKKREQRRQADQDRLNGEKKQKQLREERLRALELVCFCCCFLSLHCKGISKSWGLGCTKGENCVLLFLQPTLLSKENRLIMTFQYCLIAYVRQEWPPLWVRVGPLSFKDYWLWVVFLLPIQKTFWFSV